MIYTSHMQKIKAFLMLCYILLFIIDSFFHIKLWTVLLVPIVITLFLIAFPKVKNFNKYLSTILIISGSYLLSKSSASPADWVDALVKNAGLTVLLLSVPMLSIIFHLEDFNSHISSFARKHVKSNFSFYILTLFMNNFFGIILNVASFPMVNKLLENISGKYAEKVFYRALTRGFCLAQLWAPNFVVIAITLQYSGLEWYSYAPVGILLSIIGMILSIIMAKIDTQKIKDEVLHEAPVQENENADGDVKSVLKVIGIAAFLILFIIGFQYFSGKSILVVVPFVSVIFPIALAVLSKKLGIYKSRFQVYFNTTLPRMNNEIILFTSVGFFGHALNVSGADKYIPLIIKSTGISSPAILIPFIIMLIFILSLIGFHPILTISAISIAYFAGAIPISQLQMAAVFATAYFSYTLLSPFSGMILAVASLQRKNPLDVGININLVFWFLVVCINSVVITMLSYI